MYFRKFPKIDYDVKGNGNITTLTNIIKRVRFKTLTSSRLVNFDIYDVRDGETPEMIAHRYYEESEYHWIILLANDIQDYYNEWPMAVPQLEKFIASKYDDVDGIHHYTIKQESGDTTVDIEIPNNTGYPLATPVTNYQYEAALNEEKRRIKLIQPRYVESIEKEFERKIIEG